MLIVCSSTFYIRLRRSKRNDSIYCKEDFVESPSRYPTARYLLKKSFQEMSTQDNTSIAAIVIAIIAFFVTVGQLLQAIFGTAVGYRNCQASVIGEWATHTKRKWRWSEFRFETRFKTPNILLTDKEEFLPGPKRIEYLFGNLVSRRKTCVSRIQGSDVNSDLVGWLRLLDQLHKYTSSCLPDINTEIYRSADFSKTTLPAITVRERSWDFMPPEITRPFATSNVGDIIALAHRLGMFWTDLRPADGIMRAEGNGFSIISTTIRGFGLFLQFTHDEAVERPESNPKKKPPENKNPEKKHPERKNPEKKNYVPTAAADKLGFQIIPGDHCLGRVQKDGTRIGLPDFAFDESNRSKKVRDALQELGLESVQDQYCDYMERHSNFIGFSDLLPLVAPFMNFWPSGNPKIIAPHASVDDSPFRCREGFFVFWNRSRPFLPESASTPPPPETRSEQIIWVHKKFNEMEGKYGPTWMEGPLLMETQYPEFDEFVDDLQKIWDKTTEYLDMLEREPREPQKRFDYLDLVGSQMLQSVSYPDLWGGPEPTDRLDNEGLPAHWDKRLCFAMQTYIDQVNQVVREMARRGFHDSEIVKDAWWTMALRAMCWHRAVSFVSGPRPGEVFAAPSQFYGSKIPVFIA